MSSAFVVTDTGWQRLGATGLPNTAVTPGSYGDATHVGAFTVDAQGRLTAAANVALSAAGVASLDTITGAVTLVAGSGVTITDNSPSAGEITIAASASGSGSEIGYDQITSNVNVTGTTEGTATTLITCASHSFTGAPVVVEFYATGARPPSSAITDQLVIGLFESGTLVSRLAQVGAATTNNPNPITTLTGLLRFTPSAGSHSYVVAGWATTTTGTPLVAAGTGGPGNNAPTFVRFSAA